jgi:hypothetical protein
MNCHDALETLRLLALLVELRLPDHRLTALTELSSDDATQRAVLAHDRAHVAGDVATTKVD